ncbi:MAG: amidohydrolase family protein [Bacteroidales bacterium]|nr:amidohydrolase family protein [Bacteroidales bacterium]
MRYTAELVYTLAGDPIRNGYVEVAPDGTILSVGQAEGPVDEGIICPGFVNAHCHVELSYMKGLFKKGTGMAGFIDQINALRDTSSMEDKLAALKEAMDSMWASGVQAMADISNCADSFEVKASHPMYTRTFLEVFGADPGECNAVMEGVLGLKKEAEAFGLDAAPTPHSCYTMSPELVTASSAEGLKSGFLSFHSEESDEEEEMMRYGRGPMWDNRVRNGIPTPPVTGTSSLEYFLQRVTEAVPAPVPGNVLLVHECCLTPEGAARAREVLEHPYIAVCPLSNLFIHNMLPPIPVMRESGIPICIGTDSLSSNDSLSMIDEINCLRKAFDLPLQEVLTWACLNGARFLGLESRLGTLEPGKRPGLVRLSSYPAQTGYLKSTRLC